LKIVFYVTGHGFGHAVRQFAIVNALAQRRPELSIVVRTSVAPWLVGRSVPASVRLEPGAVDTGAIQRGSLDVDVPATLAAAQAFYADGDAWIAREAAFLTREGARLVVADIPPLPFSAARQAGVPAIGISNFTWDWIYEDYDARRLAPGLVEALEAHYATAVEGWRLPMHGGFSSFATMRDLPLVARVARQPRDLVRAALSLPLDRPLVLVSLGGFGARGIDLHAAAASLRGVADVVTTSFDAFTPGDGVHRVDESAMYGQRIRYEDLVGAVDVVASKPGYGIISECGANGTALLYTDRGRFCEYDVLVREMPRYVDGAFLDQEDLLAGRWRDAVTDLLARPPRAAAPAEGAATAADWLSARLG
jgi:UDP:flavonoid glycosyltransferase YjiC (YdhE family)